MEWSDESTIGFNALGEFFENHPLTGSPFSDAIDCVHSPESVWNNVIYDLVPGELIEGPTPEPPNSFGKLFI